MSIRGKTLRFIPFVGAVAAISCAVRESTPRDTVVFAVESNPRSLDPRFAADSLASKISELACPGLTARDTSGTLVPELAESWTWETATRLRFRLREGLVFHDGSPVEAEDVAATYRSILDPATGSLYAAAFGEIDSIETPSAREVVFILRSPSAPILQDLVSPGVMKRGLPRDALAAPVCAGPFRVVSFRRDDAVELEAFAGYWRGAPAIRRVVFRILPDATIRVLELAHGGVDLLQNDFPPHFVPVLKKEKGVRLERREGRNVKYLVFNLRKAPLGDVRVRRAIAHAIDREALIRHKLEGQGRLADSVLVPEDPFAVGGWGVPFDLDASARLLDEAGLAPDAAGVRLRLEWKTSTSDAAIATAKVIKWQLAKAGIEVTIRPAEFGVFFKDVQTGNFEIYSLTSSAIVDPDFLRWLLHSENVPPKGQLSNRQGYVNTEVDRLLDLGMAETIDVEKRKAHYAEIQRIAARDLPIAPLWFEDVVVARSERLEGYELSPFASYVGLAKAAKR